MSEHTVLQDFTDDHGGGNGPSDSFLPTLQPRRGSLEETNLRGSFAPVDLQELFEEPPEHIEWIVEGYVAKGLFSLLSGSPKLGKTTLAYQLIIAIARGLDYLGSALPPVHVLILALEEHRRDVVGRLRADLETDLKVDVKLVFAPLLFSAAIHQKIAHYIQEHNIGLVLVDTLPAWWGLEDENNASEVLRKGMPLLNMIRQTDAAWLCLAHTRKSGGENGQEVRGSSALVGLVDIAITMKRTEGGGNQRLLESVSRYADTPPKLVVAYQDGRYSPLGTPDSVSAEAKAQKVWEATSFDDPQTVEELSALTHLSKQDVSRGLSLLGDKVYRMGEGVRGRPYEYLRTPIHPTPGTKE